MSDHTSQQYQTKINQIKAILAFLQTETEEARKYRELDAPDHADVDDLDRIIARLTPVYGILVADEAISLGDILHRAEFSTDNDPETDTAPDTKENKGEDE